VQYWGGRVISNVKVYAVFWGDGVDASVRSGIGGFLRALTNSDWIDWQNEYRTDVAGLAGTGQLIGRGTFAGEPIEIVPSAAASCAARSNSNPLHDSTIQAELAAQISAGALPPPDANTLYMLYFPPGCVLSSGGANSCMSGGFCAYHGTLTLGGQSVFYGVVPDFGAASGCDVGCGSGTTFENVCSATSHEVGEAITDAQVGLASALAAPLAWYDPENGEHGDMCAHATGSIASLEDGTLYTVQQMYSRRTGFCHALRTDRDDFKVFMHPNRVSAGAGATVIVPVSTALTAGAPAPLRFALGPLPAGTSGTVDPASARAGDAVELRLSVDGDAAVARDAVVVVIACAGEGPCPSPSVAAHTASILLQVNAAPSVDLTVPASASRTVRIDAVAQAAPGTTLRALSITIDGREVGAGGAAQLSLAWDTTKVANGAHEVIARAIDADGGTRSARSQVVVTNEGGGCSSPGTPGAGTLLALVALALRRRRTP